MLRLLETLKFSESTGREHRGHDVCGDDAPAFRRNESTSARRRCSGFQVKRGKSHVKSTPADYDRSAKCAATMLRLSRKKAKKGNRKSVKRTNLPVQGLSLSTSQHNRLLY